MSATMRQDVNILQRVSSVEFQRELHKLLWLEPFFNQGVRDLGWNCRDHALIIGSLLELYDCKVQVVHGKACFVQGPTAERRPIALEQEMHTWLMTNEGRVVDLSPNLSSAVYPGWTTAPFTAIINSQWQPAAGGQFILSRSSVGYEEEISIGSNTEGAFRAVYLEARRQPFVPAMLSGAFAFVNSPLTDRLRKRYDQSVYAKAVAHLAARLGGTVRSLAGVSQNKGWAIIAERPTSSVADLMARAQNPGAPDDFGV